MGLLMSLPTIEELRFFLDYNPESGEFKNKITRGNSAKGSVIGSINGDGYLRVRFNKREFYLHRLAYYMHYGFMPEFVDHINGVRTDNRAINLREATISQNGMNKLMQSNNTSGFKGVTFHKRAGKWVGFCTVNRIRKSTRYHETAKEASDELEVIRINLHKEFSNDGHGSTTELRGSDDCILHRLPSVSVL